MVKVLRFKIGMLRFKIGMAQLKVGVLRFKAFSEYVKRGPGVEGK